MFTGNPIKTLQLLCAGAFLLLALYVVTFPLQDYDTFWHLAYGRAMVETGAFINHEIFSYTSQGKYLGSHSQLAQVILYLLWLAGGANALLAFKLVMATLVFALVVATTRLFGAGSLSGAIMALAVLVVGIGRVVERPEIFSILLQALLIWILFRSRKFSYPHHGLWSVPLILVLWDYLHGALYGLIVTAAFIGAEVCRLALLPRLGCSGFADKTSLQALKRLLGWGAVSFAAVLSHPNGLWNYSHFWRVASSGAEYQMFGEFMPPYSAQFYPYWLFLGFASILILLCIRHVDMTALAVMLPFLYLSLTYNRAVLAFSLAAVPAVAQALVPIAQFLERRRLRQGLAVLVVVGMFGGVLAYKQYGVIESHRFGTGINDQVFPVGAVRFVVDQGLSGNMYNMDAFGGYLAFWVSPERRIFNYNQPGVFSALFDYLHKPESRDRWDINYAFVGREEEARMFHHDGFVPIYRESCSAVYVRDNPANAGIVDRFRIYYFNPLLSDRELLALGRDQRSGEKLLREMSTYLAYREDPRIATLFTRLLRESPVAGDDAQKAALLAPAMVYNGSSAALLAAQGELAYRMRDFRRAEELFRQTLEREEGNFAGRIGLGYLFYDQGRLAEALEHFSELTSRYPQAADARYALGLASLRLCRKETARAEFEQFLELAPESPYAGKAKAFLRDLDATCGP